MSEILSKTYIDLNVKYPLVLSGLIKLEFSRQICEQYSNTKFHENTLFHYGRADPHVEANSRFCERA